MESNRPIYNFHGLIHEKLESGTYDLFRLIGNDGIVRGYTILKGKRFESSHYTYDRAIDAYRVLNMGNY